MWCGVVYKMLQTPARARPASNSPADRSRYGTVLRGVGRCGGVWYGMVWCGVVWCGVAWCGLVWYIMVWCVVGKGRVWYGMVWHGVVCYGTLCCSMGYDTGMGALSKQRYVEWSGVLVVWCVVP